MITDPSGSLRLAVVPSETTAVPVPTLSDLALALLGLLMVTMATLGSANRRRLIRRILSSAARPENAPDAQAFGAW